MFSADEVIWGVSCVNLSHPLSRAIHIFFEKELSKHLHLKNEDVDIHVLKADSKCVLRLTVIDQCPRSALETNSVGLSPKLIISSGNLGSSKRLGCGITDPLGCTPETHNDTPIKSFLKKPLNKEPPLWIMVLWNSTNYRKPSIFLKHDFYLLIYFGCAGPLLLGGLFSSCNQQGASLAGRFFTTEPPGKPPGRFF